MREKPHNEVAIPEEWSGEQAKTVWEFLETVMEAIWDVHGNKIENAVESEERLLLDAARGEPTTPDDCPF